MYFNIIPRFHQYLLFVLIILGMSFPIVHVQASTIELEEKIGTSGVVKDLILGNGVLYALTDDGLVIYDITNPNQPIEQGRVEYDLYFSSGEKLFLGDGIIMAYKDTLLAFIDISNPAAPSLLGKYEAEQNILDLVVKDNFLFLILEGTGNYVLSGYGGNIFVMDLSDLQSLTQVARLSVDTTKMVLSSDQRFLYIFTVNRGLQVFDIQDISAIREIASADTEDLIRATKDVDHALIKGKYLIADNALVNVANPYEPALKTYIDFGAIPITQSTKIKDAFTDGEYLYYIVHDVDKTLHKYGRRLLIFDFSKPSKSALLSEQQIKGHIKNATSTNNIIFLAQGNRGITLFDTSDINDPKKLFNVYPDGRIEDLSLMDGRLYVVDYETGLHIFDAKEESLTHEQGNYFTKRVFGFTPLGQYGYLMGGENIVILDVKNAKKPKRVGTFSLEGSPTLIVPYGSYCFIVAGSYNIVNVVDITNPLAPEIKTTFNTQELQSDTISDMEINDSYLYLTTPAGFAIYNIQDPLNPEKVWSETGNVRETEGNSQYGIIILHQTFAYILDRDQKGAMIFDVADPRQAEYLGFVSFDWEPMGMDILDEEAVVATFGGGLVTLDLSDPSTPAVGDGFQDASIINVGDVIMNKHGRIFAAIHYDKLAILQKNS